MYVTHTYKYIIHVRYISYDDVGTHPLNTMSIENIVNSTRENRYRITRYFISLKILLQSQLEGRTIGRGHFGAPNLFHSKSLMNFSLRLRENYPLLPSVHQNWIYYRHFQAHFVSNSREMV